MIIILRLVRYCAKRFMCIISGTLHNNRVSGIILSAQVHTALKLSVWILSWYSHSAVVSFPHIIVFAGDLSFHLKSYLIIQEIFTEYLLYARHCL